MVTKTELEGAVDFVTSHLNPVMRTGSYAFGFVLDLAMVTAQRRYNLYRLVEEIAALEGSGHRPSSTKPPSEFRGKHLRGYWHKHHTQARYMAHNVMEEMKRDNTIEKFLTPRAGEDFTPQLIAQLAHKLIHDNYLDRQKEARLTGEWIIFSKAETKNHYLTLAWHDEPDENIAERLHRYEEIDRSTAWQWDKRKIVMGEPSVSGEAGEVTQ